MHRALDLLQEQTTAIACGALPDMRVFGFALDYLRNFPAVLHHPKEDLMYHRMYVCDAGFKTDIDNMLVQHRQLYELENRVADAAALVLTRRTACRGRLLDLVRTYLETQRKHGRFEEQVMFPNARWLLTPRDWAYLDSPSDDMQVPMFSAAEVKRFESLFLFLARPPLFSGHMPSVVGKQVAIIADCPA